MAEDGKPKTRAEKRYANTEDMKKSSKDDDDKEAAYPNHQDFQNMRGMQPDEMANYHQMRTKGLKEDESQYHATNPRGRLAEDGAPDPWAAPRAESQGEVGKDD